MMTVDKKTDFFKLSRNVVCDYLQTVVMVDDKVEYNNWFEKASRLQYIPGRLTDTPSLSEKENVDEELEGGFDDKVVHLDKLISEFAEKGIIFSLYEPPKDHLKLKKNVFNLAKNSDALILDWELEKEDKGALALEILTEVIQVPDGYPEQLRLILVYTGTQDILLISENIFKHFGEKAFKVNDFTIEIGTTRISVYIKPHTDVINGVEKRKLNYDQLADTVIDEFTEMNAGLVSNTVLKALSVIRQNSSKILNKFSSHLDAPYLTHRALLQCTEDAEILLPSLFSEEIRSILEEYSVGECANIEVIKNWLLLHEKNNFTLRIGESEDDIPLDKIVTLLNVGIADWGELNKSKKKKSYKSLTDLFRFENDKDKFLDDRFSFITTNRSFYGKIAPELRFGTIIQDISDESYLVCIQPICDSFGIDEGERAFPFLPLVNVNNDEKFNITLRESDRYIRLSIQKKPFKINMISFIPDPTSKRIKTKPINKDGHLFEDTKGIQFKWVGELRPEHMQRIANQFAAELSRVGVVESEWLRRHSG